MKKTFALAFFISFLWFIVQFYSIAFAQTNYTLIPDFPDYTKVPVNYETELSATITPNPSFSITVTVKLQWQTFSMQIPSDPSTGKVKFKIKPPSSFSRTPQTITFSASGYFETVTSHIICVPGVFVEGMYETEQYLDPLEGKDIVINMTVKDSETNAVITVPSGWAVNVVGVPSGTSPTNVQFLPPKEVASGVYQISLNSLSDTVGRYDVEVKAFYSDYIPIPSLFTVYLNPPIIVITYKFETGETITIKPKDVSLGKNGIQVTKGCRYFDMEFKDFQGRPVRIYLSTFDVTITSSTMTFTKKSGQVSCTLIADNIIRVNFALVESWYIITPDPQYTVYIGNYPVSIVQNEVKVATIQSGFNIWDFITNPYIMVPAFIIAVLLITRLFRKKQSKNGEN